MGTKPCFPILSLDSMTSSAMGRETIWQRAWRRLRLATFVTFAAGSIRITQEASTHHCLVHVSTFLRAGGQLSLERAGFQGTELMLQPDAWFCLSAFAQLLKHGAEVRKSVEGFDISLPSGRIFELPSEHLLPSALVVLHERFVADEYRELQVAGAVVIDVGAHIGDSAVYFADKGAVHVYALEPFHEPYAAAARVISRNLLDDRVTVIPRGVGAQDGRGVGFYDPSRSDVARASLRSSTHQPIALLSNRAQEVEVMSLPSVLDMARMYYPGRPLVLKVDCEGCEVEVLEGEATRESLEAVESILLEVHDDDCDQPNAQRTKLEEWGFSVALTHQKTGMELLLAVRQGSGEDPKGSQ